MCMHSPPIALVSLILRAFQSFGLVSDNTHGTKYDTSIMLFTL